MLCTLLALQLDAVSRLVLGTEDCRVLILNAAGTAVDKAITLPAVPAFLATTGESRQGAVGSCARLLRFTFICSAATAMLSCSRCYFMSVPQAVSRSAVQCSGGTGYEGSSCCRFCEGHLFLMLLVLLLLPGELDEGYRITVAARDGRLYNIKSGALSRSVIQLDSQPVGVVSSWGARCWA